MAILGANTEVAAGDDTVLTAQTTLPSTPGGSPYMLPTTRPLPVVLRHCTRPCCHFKWPIRSTDGKEGVTTPLEFEGHRLSSGGATTSLVMRPTALRITRWWHGTMPPPERVSGLSAQACCDLGSWIRATQQCMAGGAGRSTMAQATRPAYCRELARRGLRAAAGS